MWTLHQCNVVALPSCRRLPTNARMGGICRLEQASRGSYAALEEITGVWNGVSLDALMLKFERLHVFSLNGWRPVYYSLCSALTKSLSAQVLEFRTIVWGICNPRKCGWWHHPAFPCLWLLGDLEAWKYIFNKFPDIFGTEKYSIWSN